MKPKLLKCIRCGGRFNAALIAAGVCDGCRPSSGPGRKPSGRKTYSIRLLPAAERKLRETATASGSSTGAVVERMLERAPLRIRN